MIKALAKPKPIAQQPAAAITTGALIARCEGRSAAGTGCSPLRASVRGTPRPGERPRGPAGRMVLSESRCSANALFSTTSDELSGSQDVMETRRGLPPAPQMKVCFE